MDSIHFKEFEDVQKLVLDVADVQRNHRHLDRLRAENVVEHSAAVAFLAWRIFEIVKPPLDLSLILRYALIHDVLERGQQRDINTYADASDRKKKDLYEQAQLALIDKEFEYFEGFRSALHNYEARSDEEARFVWTVDKIQAKILGNLDKWDPYKRFGITFEEFHAKGNEQIQKAPECLKDIVRMVMAECEKTYYDQPDIHHDHRS